MDNMIDEEYKSYWASLQPDELDSYFEEMSVGGYYDSSSPDGGQDQWSAASKNIVSERNRRKKLNERLYALRAVVPNITKMDKASIIKDAIEYIESLHSEERRVQAEISEMESGVFPQPLLSSASNPNPIKRSRTMENYYDNYSSLSTSAPSPTSFPMQSSPIQLLELRVSSMGEKTIVVSLTCSKGTDTMVKLCDIFESLDLKIITANITAFSGRLLKTVFLEGDEVVYIQNHPCSTIFGSRVTVLIRGDNPQGDDDEKDVLSLKIRAAIAAQNDPDSPSSI